MSRAELAKIHRMMEKANGDRALAAAFLGITYDQLRVKILDNKELKARWGLEPSHIIEPKAEQTLQAPPELAAVAEVVDLNSEKDRLALVRLKAEEASVQEGLTKMGFDDRVKEIATACGAMFRKNFIPTMEIMAGGLAHTQITLMGEAPLVQARLHEVRRMLSDNVGPNGRMLRAHSRGQLVEEEGRLAAQLNALSAEIRQCSTLGQRSAAIMAEVKVRARVGRPKVERTGKAPKNVPGYATNDSQEDHAAPAANAPGAVEV